MENFGGKLVNIFELKSTKNRRNHKYFPDVKCFREWPNRRKTYLQVIRETAQKKGENHDWFTWTST